jgi:predicted anti-sigma-YlaC factor YlaD
MSVRALLPKAAFVGLSLLLVSSCSLNRMAVRTVANALTAEGGSAVFTGDDDPELVGDALPFAVKMYESLLVKAPDHEGLILTTGSLFVMYANAFVQAPAETLPRDRFAERKENLERAKRLYLRGRGILVDGLERKHPGFRSSAKDGTLSAFLARMRKDDVPLLYWSAAAAMAAFSLDPFDVQLSVRLPEARALMARAYELDPGFGNGMIDDFYISYYGSLPDGLGGDKALALKHFKLAVEKTKGLSAGPFVSYAQAVSVPAQDYAGFKKLLEQALAIDVAADPSNRLANVLSQRRARFLLSSAQDLFLDAADESNEGEPSK